MITTAQYLLGLGFAFITSWMYASVIVLNRVLKEIHFAVILFYYTLFGSAVLLVYILAAHAQTGSSWSSLGLLNYSTEQWGQMLALAFFNSVGMNFNTLACQYEKNSAFISLVGYMNIIYSFGVDTLLFGENFNRLEMMGSLTVLVFNLSAVVIKLRQST